MAAEQHGQESKKIKARVEHLEVKNEELDAQIQKVVNENDLI